MSVSLRNALTNGLRSPSWPMQLGLETRVLRDEGRHELADGRSLDLDALLATGRRPERGRDPHRAHDASPSSQRSKADRLGRMTGASPG